MLDQISQDPTWIEEQVRAGILTREDAEQSSLKHVITRSVGFELDVEIDLITLPVLAGDCFILCSDGLTNHLHRDHLVHAITSNYYCALPDKLVTLANQLGGEDNITAVVIYVA